MKTRKAVKMCSGIHVPMVEYKMLICHVAGEIKMSKITRDFFKHGKLFVPSARLLFACSYCHFNRLPGLCCQAIYMKAGELLSKSIVSIFNFSKHFDLEEQGREIGFVELRWCGAAGCKTNQKAPDYREILKLANDIIIS